MSPYNMRQTIAFQKRKQSIATEEMGRATASVEREPMVLLHVLHHLRGHKVQAESARGEGTLNTVSPENICMTMGNVGNWSISSDPLQASKMEDIKSNKQF